MASPIRLRVSATSRGPSILTVSTPDPQGPLSLPIANWSIFNLGLQLDLVRTDIVNGLRHATGPAAGCASLNGSGLPVVSGGKTQLPNGMATFLGAFPIYRGNTLVGAISGSGDGGQQDDLIPFLALQNGPATLNQAPAAIRDDQLAPGGVHLKYANCPASPFLNSSVQNPC